MKRQQEGGHLQARKRGSEETDPAGTLILTPSLQGCETKKFRCLNHHVCGILLWQP